MEKRVDRVVEKVVRLHKEYLERVAEGKESEGDEGRGGDILIVSHGRELLFTSLSFYRKATLNAQSFLLFLKM